MLQDEELEAALRWVYPDAEVHCSLHTKEKENEGCCRMSLHTVALVVTVLFVVLRIHG